MPAVDDPPQRNWWNSIARSPSARDLRQGYVEKSGKLTSLATAIGFKPKKHSPTLTIQDPPPAFVQQPQRPPNRPPSKSVSSSRTAVDSIEPRTPVDAKRDQRHSLLTLSDTDPFAGRPVITVPVPHLPSDPNRLSAYSNSSASEVVPKKLEHLSPKRVSYASSSSNSNSYTMEFPVTEPLKVVKSSEHRQLATKRSVGSIQFKHSGPLHRQASVTPATTATHSKVGSASTLLDPHRRSQQPLPGPPRPTLRTRGLTESGPSKPTNFFVDDRYKISRKPSSSDIPHSQDPPSSTTRVVTRQASMTRIQPPSAPPTQSLPPPPHSAASGSKHSPTDVPKNSQRRGLFHKASTNSTTSYASSESLSGSPYGAVDSDKQSAHSHGVEREPESPISFVQPKESYRTLKKALSHQSLTRRGLSLPPSAPPPGTPPPEPEKRKQRAFHHPRLPIPPIPLPNIRSVPSSASSNAFPTSSNTSDSGASYFDKRRGSGSAASTSSRRRLFSTSSRPSTAQSSSQHTPGHGEDDNISLFSLRSDADSHLTPYKPWISRERKTPSSPTFWEEGSSDHHVPSSPAQSTDYSGPQAIMSRAELAKLEESVESWSLERSKTRSRGMSVLSASTAASDMSRESDVLPMSLSPRPPAPRPISNQVSIRASTPTGPHSRPPSILSDYDHQMYHQPQPQPQPPHPPHPQQQPPAQQQQQQQQQQYYQASSNMYRRQPQPLNPLVESLQITARNPIPDIMSLPPPPRRRKGTMIAEPDVPEDAVAPPTGSSMSGTPTPSLMAVSRAASTVKRGAGSMRSKYSVEKNLHRRSIMRKSSFLNIDDDDDDDFGQQAASASTMSGGMTGSDSFLDLARESFDTVRTGL